MGGIAATDLSVDQNTMEQWLEETIAKTKRKEWQRHCTVIPREWELRLLDAKRVSTYRLAIELLYLHWYGKGNPIAVTGKVAEATRLSDRSKSRALAELERLGLIEIDRSPRKSPRVALHHVPAK